MNDDFAGNGHAALGLFQPNVPKKSPPSAISNHLREELIRILQTGDDKNDGAFTIGVAAQVEKFTAAAREILMTENLAKQDISSLMMMRGPRGPYGGLGFGNTLLDSSYVPMPPINNENFGVQAIKELVESFRTVGESPAKLVEALAAARSNNLTDVVAVLEKKLGVSKPLEPMSPNVLSGIEGPLQ